MAKAAAIDLNKAFSPPPQTTVITPPSAYGDFLPSLSANPAGPGPGSAASQRLTGHVRAMSASRERTSTASSYASKRLSGPVMATSTYSPPSSLPSPPSGDLHGTGTWTGSGSGTGTGLHNPKLPPLSHGYGAHSPGGTTGTPSTAASQSHPYTQHGDKQSHGEKHGEKQSGAQQVEAIQPLIQHAAMLPGPTAASYPYQHKRKPPSAFMRNNPMLQQLEMGAVGAANHHTQQQRSASAGSTRPHLGSLFDSPRYGGAGVIVGGSGAEGAYGRLPSELQAQQFAQEVMAAAQAAMTQGNLHQAWGGEEDGGAAGTAFVSSAPWGVSSVSDLEALDSILDQLVVVDARMRKALLKGPLISFETVVPEHVMYPSGNGARQQQQQDEERDRTFITAVKGVADENGVAAAGEEGPGGGAAAEHSSSATVLGLPPPPPSPAEPETSSLGGAFSPAAGATNSASAPASTRQTARPMEEYTEVRDSSLFPASIPNTGMHPNFTRAYMASKMAVKPQHLSPPPPATAEHLLRSRPPPFIAAPSYDQLCSQIRDVQRQYTCGSSRPAGGPAAAGGAGTAAMGGAGFTAAVAAGLPVVPPSAHQYIAGLDGPTLDEVVAHQELPCPRPYLPPGAGAGTAHVRGTQAEGQEVRLAAAASPKSWGR